ncbi:hypothetical protein SMQE20_25350 [Serratia marcescens]|nr:hypothetical protein SMQE20_25350 [Serratia marcescens]
MSRASEYYWTEEYHLYLEEMDKGDATKDVESMSDDEIHYKVNMRKYQQDYIADYLEYLWEISQKSFWAHILVMFSDETELLLSDNMKFASILCNEVAPREVISAIVKYTINADTQGVMDPLCQDILSEIIQEQNKLCNNGIALCDIYGKNVSEQLNVKFSTILSRNINNSFKDW